MFNPMMAQSEMERRYTFVTEGAQSARWLRRLAKDGLHAWSNRFAQAAGKTLIAVGTWLAQGRQLDSAHA